MNTRVVFNLISYLLMVLSIAVAACWGVSIALDDPASVQQGLARAALSILLGGAAIHLLTRGEVQLSRRDGFGIVFFGWLMAGLFGCLPYLYCGTFLNPVDALFETISGFTTTGASAHPDPGILPAGILVWRSMTQWFGGMGVLVLCVAILPFLGVGGMQIYRAEMPGPSKDRLTPRIAGTAKLLWGVYLGMTVLETLLLKAAGMTWFDAVNHAFTTVSTGGFSTRTASIAAYDSVLIEGIITVFMLLAGINFSLHFRALRGRPVSYLRDPEFRFFACLWAGAVVFVTLNIWVSQNTALGESIRAASFMVSSIMTTTGYGTADYDLWPEACRVLMIMLMISGGCAGSTAGGLKIVRLFVVFKKTLREIRLFMQPRAVVQVKLGRKALDVDTIFNISAFFIIFILIFVVGTLLMAFFTPDLDTAASSVAATLGNIGPGLGAVGPTQNFAFIPAPGKLLLILFMLLGRLELYTVLAILLPSFWKR